jgi:hypothetical protein
LAVPAPAHAGIGDFGPVDLAHGNYPSTFTDADALSLELCLDGPFCLASAERPDPGAPVSPFDNFPGESFWWAGEAAIGGAVDALLVLAQEAAFTGEDAVDGEQIAFGRVRIRVLSGLTEGDWYRFTHPYGVLEAQATGGSPQVNSTDDVGCLVPPCNPDGWSALGASQVGPTFLRWDASAPDPPAGFIGDPALPHTVVGSPNNTNFFRIERIDAPGGAVQELVAETDLFAIQGKLATAAPFLVRTPDSIDFGSQVVGTTSGQQTVTVTNGGQADLTVSGVTIDGANAADFAQSNDCVGGALASGSSCSINVSFSPGAVGTRGATVNIASDDPLGAVRTVALSGAGVLAGGGGGAGAGGGAGGGAGVGAGGAGVGAGGGQFVADAQGLLRVRSLRGPSRLSLRRARRSGVTARFIVPDGTEAVQASLYRNTNASTHRTRRLLKRLTVGIGRPGRHAVRFRDRRTRSRLRRGSYTISIAPSPDGTTFAEPTAKRFRIR